MTNNLPEGVSRKKYCDKMSKDGTQGGQIELEAIVQAYCRKVQIYD